MLHRMPGRFASRKEGHNVAIHDGYLGQVELYDLGSDRLGQRRDIVGADQPRHAKHDPLAVRSIRSSFGGLFATAGAAISALHAGTQALQGERRSPPSKVAGAGLDWGVDFVKFVIRLRRAGIHASLKRLF